MKKTRIKINCCLKIRKDPKAYSGEEFIFCPFVQSSELGESCNFYEKSINTDDKKRPKFCKVDHIEVFERQK